MVSKTQVIAALVAPTLLANVATISPNAISFDFAGLSAAHAQSLDIGGIIRIDAVRVNNQTTLFRAPSSDGYKLLTASVAVMEQ